MSDRVILIVESNPKNTSRLQLSEELRVINDIFENNTQYKIVIINAARISDFGEALVKHEPEIVHFLGHGEGVDGLCFHGDDGKKQLLSNASTDQIFKLASNTVKFVFLNACHSEVQAKVIAKNIDYVLGMSDKIPDITALKFASSFYGFVSLNKPVHEAFEWAQTMSGAVALTDYLVPVLLQRDKYKDYQYPGDQVNGDNVNQPAKPVTAVSKITPTSPLLVIPTSPEYKLIADKHYREVEAELESYWGLLNSRRVSTRRNLERELGNDSPDLVYVYTKFENGQLLLDDDQDGNAVDLETLASWFKQSGLRPLLILVLHGYFDEGMIPDCLKAQTQYIWCLFTPEETTLDDLSIAMGRFFKRSGQSKTSNLIELIANTTTNLLVESIASGPPQELAVDAESQRNAQQFRAALLRIMLGREEIKSQLGLAIQRHLGSRNILLFAVTGSELSCVFDLPQQIYFAMLPTAKNNKQGMLIINWPLHIHVSAENCKDKWSAVKSINEVISYNIQHGSADLGKLIEDKAEATGIDAETGAIVFHWNISIADTLTEAHLKQWLTVWADIIEAKFSQLYSPTATLVHALCVKANNQSDINALNTQIRRFLVNNLESKQTLTAYSKSTKPLSALEAEEIEDFFNDPENRDWSEHFRFINYSIDKSKLADWVIEKTAGEFEDVVQTLWQSQLNNYDEFLQDTTP